MSYNSFASVYDELTENVEYEKRAEYINTLLTNRGINGGILLDLACGTGTLSNHLSKFGYDMILVDSSPEMLDRARDKNKDALILCQSMTELDLYGTINACVCSLDSVNHLLKPCDVKAMFSKVALFTEKGGAFIFDVNTEYKHREILGNNTFVYETDSAYLVWQNSYKRKFSVVDIKLDIFAQKGNMYERESEFFSERAYKLEDIEKWLCESGFGDIELYDDLSFDGPKQDSQRVYFSAVKK